MPEANLGAFLPDLGGIGKIILWGLFAVVIGLVLGAIVYFIIVKSTRKKVIEIDMVTKKIKRLIAVEKRNRSNKKQFYIPKLKKFLPNVQQEDVYQEGGKDLIILIKDNNRLHHTARLPNLDQIITWYRQVYNIDLREIVAKLSEVNTEEEQQTILTKLRNMVKGIQQQRALDIISTIYLLPNPMENLEWLADEQNQSVSIFGAGFLRHPALVWVGTLMVCGITFIITLVVSKLV